MFIRKAFITNSSSTAFVAYGIRLPDEGPQENGDYVRDKYGETVSWEEFYKKKTGLSWNDALVEFCSAGYSDDAVMYTRDSYHDIEYGYEKVDTQVNPEWDALIRQACISLGIPYKQPSWFGWFTGMEG